MSPTQDVASLLALTAKSSDTRKRCSHRALIHFLATAAYPWLDVLADAANAPRTGHGSTSERMRHSRVPAASQKVPAQIIFRVWEETSVPQMQTPPPKKKKKKALGKDEWDFIVLKYELIYFYINVGWWCWEQR